MAGRPKIDRMLKKVPCNYKLPRWLKEWLQDQDESAAVLIEYGVREANNLKSRICVVCEGFNNGNLYGCAKGCLEDVKVEETTIIIPPKLSREMLERHGLIKVGEALPTHLVIQAE